MRIETFGVRNLRCLANTGPIPLRKVTVLVGENGAGKSAFLRALAAFGESATNGTSIFSTALAPRLCDLGDVRSATGPCGETISFEFGMSSGGEHFDVTLRTRSRDTEENSADPYLLSRVSRGNRDAVLPEFYAQLKGVTYLSPHRTPSAPSYVESQAGSPHVDSRAVLPFIHSLTAAEARSLAQFTQETLGFTARVTARAVGQRQRLTVQLREHPIPPWQTSAGAFVDAHDASTGCWNALSVAAPLWDRCIRGVVGEAPPLLCIEHPEMGMHPSMQVRLTKAIVTAVTSNDDARVLVETHSEAFVNQLGMLIHKGAIAAGDVQIAVFEKDPQSGLSTVSLAGYDEEGALRDWPYGFLCPSADCY